MALQPRAPSMLSIQLMSNYILDMGDLFQRPRRGSTGLANRPKSAQYPLRQHQDLHPGALLLPTALNPFDHHLTRFQLLDIIQRRASALNVWQRNLAASELRPDSLRTAVLKECVHLFKRDALRFRYEEEGPDAHRDEDGTEEELLTC